MSSITGSCESPSNTLFKQGLEQSQFTHTLESRKADLQTVEKNQEINSEFITSSEASNTQTESNHTAGQQPDFRDGKGTLIDYFA